MARLKKSFYRADMDEQAAVTACVEALYDAADDDSATGIDLYRAIYPIVAVIDVDGVPQNSMSQRWPRSLMGGSGTSLAPDGLVAMLPPGSGSRRP